MTDFDGTLAPIVNVPSEARALDGTATLLTQLSAVFGVVGVVSGRSATFLLEKLGGVGDKVNLVGLYGLEWVERPGSGRLPVIRRGPDVESWMGRVSEIAAAGSDAPEGVELELKGPTLTVHWRNAPEEGPWAERFVNEWAMRTGLVVQPGRMALELRPPLEVDKGTVVENLAETCRAACFVGDDVGDLAAFAALDRLEAKGTRAVRVAVADEESPPELRARADLVVADPQSVKRLFQALVSAAAEKT